MGDGWSNLKQVSGVLIGGSSGGVEALAEIMRELPGNYRLPILVVQHLHITDGGAFCRHLQRLTEMRVIEPCDKELIVPGSVYTAPANYHMLVEHGGSVSLSIDERVKWSRPSIDVLFESGALVWRSGVVAVLLSGASCDGTEGLLAVLRFGGTAIVQDPESATTRFMPESAITAGAVSEVLKPSEIGKCLSCLGRLPDAEADSSVM